MIPFKKSLGMKLSALLLGVLCIAFCVLIISADHFQTSAATRISSELIKEISILDTKGWDARTQTRLTRIQSRLEHLPQQLKAQTRPPAILVSAFCITLVMALIGLFFHLAFFKPVKALSQGLEKTAQGDEKDLTIRFSTDREDEVGLLSRGFNTFVVTLDNVIQNIGSKTETVAAAASEVSQASIAMDEEASDLHTRSNSVAAAAEEMNASMQTVAAASEQAATNIAMVADAAGLVQEKITGVAKNCDHAGEISNTAKQQVDTAKEQVGRLDNAAKEINQVTQMITEIAEQTNLLALNATIEAARAGSAGKGFAVVADEIKHLASQTADATQSIREQIDGIRKTTKETVEEVGKISAVITDVDEIVHNIATSVEEQSQTATEVAMNIDQASIGISEVNENVAQSSLVASEIAQDIARVDAVAGQISTQAGHLTHGAKDLDGLSLSLRKMICLFKVSRAKGEASSNNAVTTRPIPDLMPWSAKLETAIPDIDTQHRELVRLVNQLHKAMRRQEGAAKVGKILEDLTAYTVFHFGFEERLFQRYNYPDTPAHKKIHKELVAKVAAFGEDFKSGKASVTMDLMDFLKDWLINHIMKTDMAYAPFLRDKMNP